MNLPALFRDGARFGERELLLPFALLTGMGLVTVTTASLGASMEFYGSPLRLSLKHLLNCAIGVAALIWATGLSEQRVRAAAGPILAVALLLLVLVLLPGLGSSGRWLRLPGFAIQPSEIARVALIIFLADLLARRRERLIEGWEPLVLPIGAVLLVALLVFLGPDFSSAFLTVLISLVMLFLAGMRWRDSMLICLGLGLVGLALFSLADYRIDRLVCMNYGGLIDNARGVCYQTVQSLLAISGGGLLGGGVGDFNLRAGHLPEAHTDFVFSVMVAEMGSLIAALVILLFALLFLLLLAKGYGAARRTAWFESLLCYGYAAMLASQVLVNLGVGLALLPATGLPLPFVSYGGSNFLAHSVLLGLICRGEKRLNSSWN